MATGSFDGVDFEIESEGMSRDAASRVSYRPVPGGDVTILDRMGKSLITGRYNVYCATAAAWAALEAKRNVSGVLTATEDGTMNVCLDAVRRTKRYRSGATDGVIEFTII